MTNSRYSEWFDGALFNPGHVGAWEVDHPRLGLMYSWWNGTYWQGLMFDREHLAEIQKGPAPSVALTSQSPRFRGLNYDPSLR